MRERALDIVPEFLLSMAFLADRLSERTGIPKSKALKTAIAFSIELRKNVSEDYLGETLEKHFKGVFPAFSDEGSPG
jgi:hypothetical protein